MENKMKNKQKFSERHALIAMVIRFILFPVAVFKGNTSARKFFKYYIMVIFIGAFILFMPMSLNGYVKSNGEEFKFIDAFFTAASAFSDTGLSVTTTREQFTFIGQFAILILFLLGGIGIMAIKVLIWIAIGKKVGLKERMLIQSERGSSKLGGTYELIVTAIQVIFLFMAIGTVLLTPYFYFVNQGPLAEVSTYKDLGMSLWHGFFHSVSAINNAGFDITGSASLLPYYDDVYVQVIMVFLLISGGIGFPVFYDIKRRIKHKKSHNHAKFQWSLFTKLTLVTYAVLAFGGSILTIAFELEAGHMAGSLWHTATNGVTVEFVGKGGEMIPVVITKFQAISSMIFTTFSTRNAGFSTIPVSMFQEPTKFFWGFMMFIGSSPASTAGGIRTTTFALVILTCISYASGKEKVFAFNKMIPRETIRGAMVATMLSLFAMIIGTIAMSGQIREIMAIDPSLGFGGWDGFFEVTSAFGTTGLSAGLTPYLDTGHKLFLIVLMIIGQLGVSSTILIASEGRHYENRLEYATEDVIIG